MNARATFFADQLDAASEHAARTLRRLGELTGERVEYRTSRWVTAQIAELGMRLVEGRLRHCGHVNLHAPAVVMAMAWRPGRLFCADCLGAEEKRLRGKAEARTCDVCRTVVEVIHPCTIAAGPLLFYFGACRACLDQHTVAVAWERRAG
jgi:hypothetical protein